MGLHWVLLIGEREVLVGECDQTGVVVEWCGAGGQWSRGTCSALVGEVRGGEDA